MNKSAAWREPLKFNALGENAPSRTESLNGRSFPAVEYLTKKTNVLRAAADPYSRSLQKVFVLTQEKCELHLLVSRERIRGIMTPKWERQIFKYIVKLDKKIEKLLEASE